MQYRTFEDHEKNGHGYANIFDKKNQETYEYNNGLRKGPKTDDTPLYAPTKKEQDFLKTKEAMVESVYNTCKYKLGMTDENALDAAHLAANLCYDKHIKYEDAIKEAINHVSSLAKLQSYNEEQTHHR